MRIVESIRSCGLHIRDETASDGNHEAMLVGATQAQLEDEACALELQMKVKVLRSVFHMSDLYRKKMEVVGTCFHQLPRISLCLLIQMNSLLLFNVNNLF